MSLFRFSPLAGSIAVLLAATVPMASRAQEPSPAAPPVAPAAPAAPTAPAVAPAAPVAPPAYPAASAEEMKRARDAYLQAVQAMNKARDEMNAQMRKQMGANAATIRGFALPGPATSLFNTTRFSSLPNQTVSLNLKNVSARDALAKVLDEAKIDYLIDDDFPKNAKLTLSIDGVQLSTALDLITQSAGAHWVAEKRGGKTLVRAGKNVRASLLPFSLNSSAATLSYAAPQAFANLDQAGGFSSLAPLISTTGRRNGVRLPSATASLDLRDASLRDALVKLLDKQNLSYEISDDFPKDAKITISVQDMQVSEILDRLTQSVGYQWVAEKRGDKTVVRIGKNVAPDLFRFYSGIGGSGGVARIDALKPLTVPGTNSIRVERGSGDAPFIYQYRTSEQRSTFTCPKCGKQTTIVQKADAKPGDAKDKNHVEWHYCPYCGKKVAGIDAVRFETFWQSDTTAVSAGAAQATPLQWTLAYSQPQTIDIVPFIGEPLHFDIDLTE